MKDYRKRTTHRRQKRRNNIKGGNGAADYAISVYGDGSQQHAISPTNNVIAMNQVRTGGAPPLSPAVVVGGSQLSPAIVRGGAPIELKPAPFVGGDNTLIPTANVRTGGNLDLKPANIGGNVIVPAFLLKTRKMYKKYNPKIKLPFHFRSTLRKKRPHKRRSKNSRK